MSEDQGYCIYTVDGDDFVVDNALNPWPTTGPNGEKKFWKDINFESLRVPADSWSKVKAYLLKLRHGNP